MKPLIFFLKINDEERITLSKTEIVEIVESAYQSGLQEGRAILDNFDFEFKE